MQDHLKAIQSHLASDVPALAYVDEEWGQLDFYTKEVPVKFPCVLLDVPIITWSNTARGGQTGTATFRVRVATLKLSNSSRRAPAAQRALSGAIWPLLGDVYKALQGWKPSAATSALVRTAQRRVKRDDGILMYEMDFTAQVADDSGRRNTPTTQVVVTPSVVPGLQSPAS